MNDDLKQAAGISFIEQTTLDRATIRTAYRPDYGAAPAYKSYPDAAVLELPRAAWQLSEARIINLLQRRRSLRTFAETPVSLHQLAFVLWASQGVTALAGNHLLRTAPSAGALYPIETYVSLQRVEGQASGIYHFDTRAFQLRLVVEGDQGSGLAAAFLGQQFLGQASFCLVWTAVSRRSMGKYGDRGVRYLLLDAGHICQNALLAAEAVNLGSCPAAAFYDRELNDLLGIDGYEEIALYGAAFGAKQETTTPLAGR
ncbi:SagB/ThcOx family dehydrogenase [Desulfofustis limnaeus]|uniref:Thioester oxidase n=1 Tax=Desulfofustis limnaeus TaxID=2740163 RepID=A0ABN6M6K1_9BACT|nr:SagB/ThcOx family dehydrogenase [Desulfofustis limnaeus]BDD87208.1 thioester oxidase [Desulfofustis limnaeus]